MKHLYISLGILITVLLGSLWGLFAMGKSLGETERLLEAAWDDCQEGSFEAAQASAQAARERWKEDYGLTASLVDHGPLDEVNHTFAQMEACAQLQEWDEFAQACNTLLTMVRDISAREQPLYYNIL